MQSQRSQHSYSQPYRSPFKTIGKVVIIHPALESFAGEASFTLLVVIPGKFNVLKFDHHGVGP